MTSSTDTLRFSLPTHGDSILCKMKDLREKHCFCDVTLLLGSPSGSGGLLYRFHGHRVVLAASSDFLRDQFLLHEGRAELSVGVVSSVRVAKTLLMSCYTGILEVPLEELLYYLTAASALQMSQVVDKCIHAISLYLKPSPFSFKLEKHSYEEESLHLDCSWPSSIFENQREKDAVLPSIQEDKTKEQGAVLGRQGLRVREEPEMGEPGLVKKTEKESVEDGLDTTPKCRLHPPKVFQDLITFTASKVTTSAAPGELVGSLQKQHEQPAAEITAEGNTFPAQQSGELSVTRVSNPRLSPEDTGDESDDILVQRPYLCRRCDKIFQHLWSYVGHLKEHRRYSCLICGQIFSQKKKLSRHIRVHAIHKPFRCPQCLKTFTQEAMLQEHLHLQTGGRPHRCGALRGHQSKSNSTDVLEKEGQAAD